MRSTCQPIDQVSACSEVHMPHGSGIWGRQLDRTKFVAQGSWRYTACSSLGWVSFCGLTAAHGRTLDGALLHGTFTGIHSSVSRLGASDHISDQVLIGMMSLLEKTEQSNSPAWSAATNPQSCSSAFGLGTRSGIQAATRTLFELLSYDEPRPKLQVLGRKATTLSSGQCFAECCRQH